MPRAQRRAQLLHLAEELFARSGYHHVAMDDVADAAGISKPILYRHFVSKIDLYLNVVDVQGALLVAAVREGLARAASAPGDGASVDGAHVVDAVVEAYVAYARDAGPAASLLFESDVMRDPEVRARVLAPHETVAAELATVLEPLTGLDHGHALVVARTCTGIARSAAAEVDRRTADDAHHLVPQLAWGGLRGMLGSR
ncbi:TetR family transcriptional regulator [Sediminihabitans luteus]|uniref:TetR family transcriptional regulator n=2 Tax=Sediminihabitans luteus TaxID=1138585 RepID=A0A2M9CZ41_9CELL|nr:TetR family transcriptional regulator [Sediminihabitans luteus]GIJ00376.1 TetR family transcriptional regulator [Sediminihabitans luteus]